MSYLKHRGPGRTTLAALAAGALLTGGLAAAAPNARAAASGPRGLYIVELADAPIAAYEGGVPGLARTAPGKGEKVKAKSAAAKRYDAYLDRQQAEVLTAVSGESVVYSYRVALNGFAARLSASQADLLRRQPGVLSLTENEIHKMDTQRTPTFLGLTAPGGLWDQLGGTRDAGKGVLVGIVDSGIWPENPSFEGTGPAPAEFTGDCQAGEDWTVADCNNKIVVAKTYQSSFPDDELLESEFDSPRDGSGHGSHTASTSAGNFGVEAVVDGKNLGTVSGMAPAAQIAAYKVCWNGDDGGCGSADSVAAINAAVTDGVDVINYSISGSLTNTINDPVERAFLFAARANVFVAASAGNSGPGASTVAHNSPWLTTAAAGTHDRDGLGSLTLGNGSTYTGKSITAGTATLPLVDSTTLGKPGASASEVKLCYMGTLDPAKVQGKIVTCARGGNGRTEKSLEIKNAGGLGMILYNTAPNSLNADFHYVPTVHVDEVAGAAIVAYAGTAGATAQLAEGQVVYGVPAPEVAAFSSRGPALASSGDLLKPDIMAPGVDVLAAVAPPSNNGRNFDFYSGTSMSSPHIAGIGALLKQAHPTWSPAAVKSAMMTTATQSQLTGGKKGKGANIPGGPFDYGAGQVLPNSATNPGLVFDAGFNDWIRFSCGNGDAQQVYAPNVCNSFGSVDPSDLNYPSIAIGSLAGTQTVTRTVKNVTARSMVFEAKVSAPRGTTMVVTPATFTIAPGASQTFTVKFTRTTAAFDEYTAGSLTWKNGKYKYEVRSPIVVRPVPIAVPESVAGTGQSGSATWKVTSGYTGTLSTRVDGLKEATADTKTYADGGSVGFNDADPASEDDNPAVKKYVVTVPAGATYARWSTFADASSAAVDDIDMFVYQIVEGSPELVGVSATGSSDETVSLDGPEAGSYLVYVHNWDSDSATNDISLFSWLLDGGSAGNATVTAPSSVSTGQQYDVSLAWTGLAAGKRYLGRVVYNDGSADIGDTVVSIN